MNMMQNGMMGNMNNLSPALMGHPGILGQSPFQRSYSAPQFQSTPNSHHQRFTEGKMMLFFLNSSRVIEIKTKRNIKESR